jgi:hypothetical protein
VLIVLKLMVRGTSTYKLVQVLTMDAANWWVDPYAQVAIQPIAISPVFLVEYIWSTLQFTNSYIIHITIC